MVDRAADRSVARQVADALRAEIESGQIPPGMPLPSEVALSQRFGVARVTARVAVSYLRSEGLVVTFPGRGTFVRVPPEVRTVEVTPPATITARVPTEAERRVLGITEGTALLIVSRPDEEDVTYPADRVRLQVVERLRQR